MHSHTFKSKLNKTFKNKQPNLKKKTLQTASQNRETVHTFVTQKIIIRGFPTRTVHLDYIIIVQIYHSGRKPLLNTLKYLCPLHAVFKPQFTCSTRLFLWLQRSLHATMQAHTHAESSGNQAMKETCQTLKSLPTQEPVLCVRGLQGLRPQTLCIKHS